MFKLVNRSGVNADHEAIGAIELGCAMGLNSKEWCRYILHHYAESIMEWLIKNQIRMVVESDGTDSYITLRRDSPTIMFDPFKKGTDNNVEWCFPRRGWEYYYHK